MNRFECLVQLWPSCSQWLSLSSAHLPFTSAAYAQLQRPTVLVLPSPQQTLSTSLPIIPAILSQFPGKDVVHVRSPASSALVLLSAYNV